MTARDRRRAPSPTGTTPASTASSPCPQGTPRGVVVVIHGGFWKAEYDLSLGRPLAADLVEQGWAAWNLEYRRVGTGSGGGGGRPRRSTTSPPAIDRLGGPRPRPVDGGHPRPLRRRPPRRLGGLPRPVRALAGRGRRHRRRLPGRRARPAGGVRRGAGRRRRRGVPRPRPRTGRRPGRPAQQVPLDVPAVVRARHRRRRSCRSASPRGYVARATAAGARAELVEVDGDHFVVIDTGSDAWKQTLASSTPSPEADPARARRRRGQSRSLARGARRSPARRWRPATARCGRAVTGPAG